MSDRGRVVGRPDELNLALYSRLAESGELHVQRCAACGTYSHPPRYFCPRCFSGDHDYPQVSGRGTVYSYTVSEFSVEPYWRERTPYATLVVELEEGPRVVAAARDLQPEDVRIGLPVQVEVEPEGEEFAFLWARPLSEGR